MIFFLKKFILKIKSTSSLKKITKEIVINENEFKISKKIANKKKGNKNDSNFKFFFKVWLASNLVTNICEAHPKIILKEKIFVKTSISWLYCSPSHNFSNME